MLTLKIIKNFQQKHFQQNKNFANGLEAQFYTIFLSIFI